MTGMEVNLDVTEASLSVSAPYGLEDRRSVDQLRLTLKENDRGKRAMHQDLRCRRAN